MIAVIPPLPSALPEDRSNCEYKIVTISNSYFKYDAETNELVNLMRGWELFRIVEQEHTTIHYLRRPIKE